MEQNAALTRYIFNLYAWLSRTFTVLTSRRIFSGVYPENVRLKRESRLELKILVSTVDGGTGANGRDVQGLAVLEFKLMNEDAINQRT